MSDTPRTDQHIIDGDCSTLSFTRRLERELTTARARVAALEADRDRLVEALREVADHAPAELEADDGARWVGMGTMMKVCAALAGEEKPTPGRAFDHSDRDE